MNETTNFSLNLSLSPPYVEPPWEGGGAILGTTPHPAMLLNTHRHHAIIITNPNPKTDNIRDLSFGSSWLHASFALLDLFDSARFDPFGRLVCSYGPSQLPCCRGIGASSAVFSSA